MRVAALRVEILVPGSRSLKQKRAALRPVVDGLRRLGSYSVSEVAHHDKWQRTAIGVAVVAPDGGSLRSHLDKVSRYLDSRPGIEVIEMAEWELEERE